MGYVVSMNYNLFAALRAAFPPELSAVAIESAENGKTYSWLDIESNTARIANVLAGLNLLPGSRVEVQTEKSVDALFLYLAVLRAGYVYLPLNNAYQAAEIGYFIENAEPAVFVCTSKTKSWIEPIARAAKVAHVFTLDEDGGGTLMAAASTQSDQHEIAPQAADDLAAILYTSGTTGRSKGAMLAHNNLLSNAKTLVAHWGWSSSDVLIHALPIFHVHGLFVASHCALLSGAKMIWCSKFDPATVIKRLPDTSVFMGVPTLYVRLLADATLTREACAQMRLFISGSAPLLIETFNAFRERTGHTILERYGMSETVMLTSNPYAANQGERRGGTVGLALPGVGVRVRNDGGSACATNDIGNIEVRGPNVFSGYWRMPEKTKDEFTSDGWFKTGDVGKCDADGYFTIVGRSKDLIISGGYNVYPAEIEGSINDMLGVAESAVIGVPHPDFGEAVVAVVVAKTDVDLNADAIIAALKSSIANFKVPKRVFVVSDLPRNAMGKVQKNVLRELYAGLFKSF